MKKLSIKRLSNSERNLIDQKKTLVQNLKLKEIEKNQLAEVIIGLVV
jgi:hypothetical protein